MCTKQYSFALQEDKSYPITLNHIFSHNHNWDVYKYMHRGELRGVEIEEVERMLTCGDKGYRMYHCPKCGEIKTVVFGCNSRVCTHCGKEFTDKWAEKIARQTFDVKHLQIDMDLNPLGCWRLGMKPLCQTLVTTTPQGRFCRCLLCGLSPSLILLLISYTPLSALRE